ncbi:hypothetical protein J1614_010609 [Plenodomus biglobosus]|nr:hypothetical protein J1614_010609 [Plenodomus biglobosus]
MAGRQSTKELGHEDIWTSLSAPQAFGKASKDIQPCSMRMFCSAPTGPDLRSSLKYKNGRSSTISIASHHLSKLQLSFTQDQISSLKSCPIIQATCTKDAKQSRP